MSPTHVFFVAVMFMAVGAWMGGMPNVTSAEHADVVKVFADDLESGKVVVIGRLGSPLKTMMTIRGTWQRNRMSKDYGPSFHVTHVNGKTLDKPVIFYQVLVHVSYPRPWDEHDESKNRPEPSAGKSWEIRAYETGRFVDSPGEYKEELGELLPYLEQATVWRNFKVELHGVMRRPNTPAKNSEVHKAADHR